MVDFTKIDLQAMASSPTWALEIGKAAEHLVCADLIIQGFRSFLSDQGLPYDLVVDVSEKLVRVQVKCACFARNVNASGRREHIAYMWSVRRRGRSKRGARLSLEHCDIVALVALDIREIAYVPVAACSETVTLRARAEAGRYGYTIHELGSFQKALDGQPRSLSTKGRRAGIRRNGQLTLLTGGMDVPSK
jgi:hypothetical protein